MITGEVTSSEIFDTLYECASEKRRQTNERFFKTGIGGYSEGDVFIGVRMPDIRTVAKKFHHIPLESLNELITHHIHEARLCALIILVLKYKKSPLKERRDILAYYLQNKEYVNNWDLVDVSAHYILGDAILDEIESPDTLFTLAQSESLWDRRIAIVANWTMIRSGRLDEIMKLSKVLLGDTEDLIHKAVGWMLREAWKKDTARVENFLIQHYERIPRTTLRYAIERMNEKKRKRFLKGISTGNARKSLKQ